MRARRIPGGAPRPDQDHSVQALRRGMCLLRIFRKPDYRPHARQRQRNMWRGSSLTGLSGTAAGSWTGLLSMTSPLSASAVASSSYRPCATAATAAKAQQRHAGSRTGARSAVCQSTPGRSPSCRVKFCPDHRGIGGGAGKPERAGLRSYTRARSTGTHVGVYDGTEAGMDAAGGRWKTLCEEHGWIISHPYLYQALSRATPAGMV